MYGGNKKRGTNKKSKAAAKNSKSTMAPRKTRAQATADTKAGKKRRSPKRYF